MSSWMENLAVYMLLVNVAMQLLPNEKYKSFVKIFTGCLLLVLMISPIAGGGPGIGSMEEKMKEFFEEPEISEPQWMERKAADFLEKGYIEEIVISKIPKVEVKVHDEKIEKRTNLDHDSIWYFTAGDIDSRTTTGNSGKK